jgi:hypothetical protein
MEPIVILLLLSCPVFVLASDRSSGRTKFGWFVVTLLLSWPGFAAFIVCTRKAKIAP